MNKFFQLTVTATLVIYIAPQALPALDTGTYAKAADEEADVNAIINDDGETALHVAARKGHTDKVRELLKTGADVNAWDKHRVTALHRAAWKGHTDTVRELLKNGADVNARDKYGQTALHRAAYRGHIDTLR